MFYFLMILSFIAQEPPPAKQLPPVSEPDWSAVSRQKPEAILEAKAHWETVFKVRDINKIKDAAERKAANERNDAAFDYLRKHPELAYDSGLDILRTTKSDWQRLTIATVIDETMKDKGRPLVAWAFAQSASPDEAFRYVFAAEYRWAERRDLSDLPALFLMLRTKNGSVYLAGHVWTIPTNRCLQYVFSRFGPTVVPYLRGALADANPTVRGNAARLLGFFLDDVSKPTLFKMLRAGGPDTKPAAHALGELGGRDAVEALTELLKNSDPFLRHAAAYALYEIGAPDSAPAVEEALKKEKFAPTKEELQITLDRLKDEAKAASNAKKLSRDELGRLLQDAKKQKGMEGDTVAIAMSATLADLDDLVEIRRLTLTYFSDGADHRFVAWSRAIHAVRLRAK